MGFNSGLLSDVIKFSSDSLLAIAAICSAVLGLFTLLGPGSPYFSSLVCLASAPFAHQQDFDNPEIKSAFITLALVLFSQEHSHK